MQPECYRQGDVFLIAVDKLPSAESRIKHSEVLAEGEVTGHAHRFAVPGQTEVFKAEAQLYVDVLTDTADLVHDEHATLALPRGGYLVRIQREYTPKGIQRVCD
jgi:hypothetical protein